MSAGRCPGLWKTLGFQPVIACVLFGGGLVAYGKMFWSSEDRRRVPFHGTFSRHGRVLVNLTLLIWLNENVRFHYAEP